MGVVRTGPHPVVAARDARGEAYVRRAAESYGLSFNGSDPSAVLDADPLADIHNIRKLNAVMKEGRVRRDCREKRVLSGPPAIPK